LEVEDHGAGLHRGPASHGIGMVAMRERSELMGGRIVFSTPADGGGTLLQLAVPREKVEFLDVEPTSSVLDRAKETEFK